MKKFFYFASALLTVFMSYSCANFDNSITEEEYNSTVIEDANGNKYNTRLVASLKGEVGNEVTLTLGVYDAFDIYGVDFGDGKVIVDTVCYQNGGLKDENGMTVEWRKSATKFTGTIAGEGIIKVYGKSKLWYLVSSGGAAPVSFDEGKLQDVVQVSITGANVEALELPQLDSLKQFTFNNSPLKSIDLSKCPALTSLIINNYSASKYAPQLESIDLSKNVNLESVQLQGNQNNYGKLKKLDLSNNTKLTGMGLYVQYNELEELIIGENELTAINVQNNKLTSLDLSKFPKLKSLYAADNQLKTIDATVCPNLAWFDVKNNQLEGDMDISNLEKLANVYVNNNKLTSIKVKDVTKQFYFDNNKMTFATMPALPASMNTTSKKKQFHYAPQADMEVTPNGYGVDLHAQATAQGILEAPVETSFTIKAGDKTLTKDTDYEIGNGLIAFKKAQMNVVVEMTSTAFPDLTLKTKPFTVGQTVMFTPSVNSAAPKSGEVVNLHNGLVTLTFGEEGGADFKAYKADSHVEGYTAFTEGNGTNGNKAGGTFYTIKPDKDGIVEVAVVLNADKAFFVEEDGTALADYNGIKKDAKYYGTFVFEVKAQKNYKFYCSGSKLGFYGFKYVY